MALSRSVDAAMVKRGFLPVVVVAATGGTAMLNYGLIASNGLLAHGGSVVASASNMVMMVMWAHGYRTVPSASSRKFVTLAAMGASCVLYLIALVTPPEVCAVLVAGLPVASGAAYARHAREIKRQSVQKRPVRKFTRSRQLLAMLIFFFIISVPLNFLKTVPSSGGFSLADGIGVTMAFTVVIFAATCALEIVAVRRGTTLVSLFIMVFSTLSLVSVMVPTIGGGDVAPIFVFTGYYLFLAMMYYGMGSIIFTTDVSPTWVFALGCLANVCGLMLGALLGLGSSSIAPAYTATVTLGITYAVIVSVFVFLPNSAYRIFIARVPVEIEVPENVLVETIEQACHSLAVTCGLSAREDEVLSYIARGRTLQTTAQRMYLSLNTIKTHVKHIYQKCGVHSQEELMVRLEEIYRNPR
ncbi:MAG: helix-turn-helix transcriptional regulator [Bifidobacteriaceae bacterium]|jgi:DNA-binding CsgD family transcriptional regulator|nr:helix-turn-helix transcriptional regulator [Bifidobacteriaceae bacterium]